VTQNRWTLEDALPLIRALQPDTKRYGYHLCLGGGVLNKGHSDKDLDLYFLPLGPNNADPDGLLAYITSLWGEGEPLSSRRAKDPSYPPDPIMRKRSKFSYSGMRIDVFIVAPERTSIL
jgi:hypothetical protein